MTNSNRLSQDILESIRNNISDYSLDCMPDDLIDTMDNHELFHRWCIWNGLIRQWDIFIRRVIEEIYEVKLKENNNE